MGKKKSHSIWANYNFMYKIISIIHFFLALPNPPGELIKNLAFYRFLWNLGRIIIKDLAAGGLINILIN